MTNGFRCVCSTQVNIHAMAFHDAILAYAQIVTEALNESQDIFDGRTMVRRFTNRTFSGVRGNFTLDKNNNVPGHFELWNFRQNSGEFFVSFFHILDPAWLCINLQSID